MGVFLRRSFLISVALFSLASTSSLETSAKETHCVEGSKTTCSSPIEDEGDTTDIFHKWTAEGQKFLSQLFEQEPSKRVEDSARDMGSEFRSLFDDLNNAFLRKETSKDEERVDIKIWRALSEAIIGEKEAGGEDVQKPWFEQLSETVDSLGKLTSELLDEKMSDFFQQNPPTNRKASASDESGASFDFIKLFQSWSSGQKFSDDESHEMMEAMIEKAAKISRILQSVEPERGLLELYKIVMGAVGKVSESFKRNFGHIEWHRLQPFSIFYFLEYMETVQTPSWKRRAHAFAPNVSFKEVDAMHRALYLANLAYMDTEEEIKGGLEHDLSEWKYVTAKLNNAPGEPAHYIAISKDSLSPESSLPLGLLGRRNSLDVLIVVRGTKDFSDVLSDGLLDAVDFRGGKAHKGIVEAGQFIVNRYRGFLNDMMKTYDRSNIKLTLIGHSLGAGAATIAGMLYNEDEKNIEANVIGFGCPSLLSKELSESTKGYVTTIISDSDLVPRLSAPTIINAFFDILSYDWVARGLKDLQFAIDFLRKKLPFIPFEKLESMYVVIKAFLEENVKPRMDDMSKIQRPEVILQPPGRCVHFYRDGNGVSGQIMECDFFDSIEISRTMIDDHLISVGYNRMLLDYMRYNHGDYEFNFGQMLNE